MKRTSKRVMAVAVSLAMVLTGSTSALAATTNPEISDREIEHKTAAKNIAAQGMVLLENKNNSLPISKEKGTKIALFGQGVYNTIKGGTGSGAVNQRDNVTVQQGFENAGYDIVDIDFVNQMHERGTANGGGTSQGWSYKWVNEPIYEQTEGAVDQIKAAAEKEDVKADMDVADICAALEKGMTEITLEGVTGDEITWTEDGEPNKAPKAVEIKDGAYAAME